MPQMAPLLWSLLFVFFLFSFLLFLILNFFIKPFETIASPDVSLPTIHKSWKL
uniref:ATP synthase F0 subunit 8 n=1 Tax=Entricoplax vestita TaxID=2115857 RepID=UPI002E78ADE8|nr:ATP synthase F0 subunit 8 [Entricoplax vestita]WRI34029.1 ATP synthase F0 subunit 8 [Entricoplax vestita]